MQQKSKKILVIIILIVIVVAVSAWLGDYAALVMSRSTTVKNGMLVQIIFLLGLIAGGLMGLAWQKLDRRYSMQCQNEPSEKERTL